MTSAAFILRVADIERARAFYRAVFGWTLTSWGRGDVCMMKAADGEDVVLTLMVATPGPAHVVQAFGLVVLVDDLAAVTDAIVANGGTLSRGVPLANAENAVEFSDPEGNLVWAARRVRSDPDRSL